tara:strand:- start:107944 stop:108216 length:273 start_codon:yes stop_codon:yes gene_type:complete
MKRWITSTVLAVTALMQAGDSVAQRPSQTRPEGRASGSRPGSVGSSTLERSGLNVGQRMPDVTIYDEDGEKFPLSRTKGKYSVLVFGCLT